MATEKPKQEQGADFARDLGYLDKFFDALDSHAGTLEAASGARLRTLLGEERTRWQEIRALVGGAPAAAPIGSGSDKDLGARAPPAAQGPVPAAGPRSFTVGSLRGRNKPAPA